MSDINPNCDGAHCTHNGQVRVYPIGAGGNLILCRSCFAHENHYNAERNREVGEFRWPFVAWGDAKHYPE